MIRFCFVVFCTFVLVAHGAESPSSASSSETDFTIDKGLVEQMYRESVATEGLSTYRKQTGVLFSPQISVFKPTALALGNNYFSVPYTEEVGSLTGVSLNVGFGLAYWKGLDVSVLGRVGYSFSQGMYSVQNKKTGASFRDQIRLHWIPLMVGPKIQYGLPSFPYIQPSVYGGLGVQWLYQTGFLDGLDQGFWLPFYTAGAGLTFFDLSNNAGAWFGGLYVGGSVINSFGSEHTSKGWAIDVAATFLL